MIVFTVKVNKRFMVGIPYYTGLPTADELMTFLSNCKIILLRTGP